MNCPHCKNAIHPNVTEQRVQFTQIPPEQWNIRLFSFLCPACCGPVLAIEGERGEALAGQGWMVSRRIDPCQVYPGPRTRDPAPKEAPPDMAADYNEACAVLPHSAKASAALARRCLQALLWAQGYDDKDLSRQIDAVLAEPNPKKSIPTSLHETLDAIRNFGNFSAHTITDLTTLQVIDVEPDEAQWCLDILVDAFDHYYVKPAQAKQKKDALDAKLKAAGKPNSK